MLLTVEWDAVAIVGHRIEEIVEIFCVEDVADVGEEGVGQPAKPTPFAKEGINVIGGRITL